MAGIEDLVGEALARPLPDLVRRDLELRPTPGLATVIAGMRRSGKTWRMFQEMARLRTDGVEAGDMLYLDFDDARVAEMVGAASSPGTFLRDVLETYYRLRPGARTRRAHLFFDELQEVDGWARFARTVLDTEDVSLYVAGSSAKLLSSEIATEFRGRSLRRELLPYSFGEYRRAVGQAPDSGSAADRSRRAARWTSSSAIRRGERRWTSSRCAPM
ncbi:MAG: AAA family ATPase [Bifidobacteriaceae bacterium]|jgi:predicted AAA+ superfamily ATPase|nr:AAA family ATPase [Bifidobacteriaceae bacterium]